jgi:hypothetical protein
VLGNGLDGQKGLLADGGVLLVGKLLFESLDGPGFRDSHVSPNFPKFWCDEENAPE